jgi:hypothetical protein
MLTRFTMAAAAVATMLAAVAAAPDSAAAAASAPKPAVSADDPEAAAPPPEPAGPPVDVGNYKLSMETLDHCHKGMMAALKRAASDEALKAELADGPLQFAEDSDTDTLDDAVRRTDAASPLWAAIMRQNNCPTREYIQSYIAGMSAADAAYAKSQGRKPDAAAGDGTAVPPENVSLYAKNKARIEQWSDEEDDAREQLGLNEAD